MSKETIVRCDKCLAQVNWLEGARIELSEHHSGGSAARAFPYQNSPALDLCDKCYGPLRSLLAEVRKAQDDRIPKASSTQQRSHSYDHV